MVETATIVRLLGSVVLLLMNGFFVTTEFAMTRVRQFEEEQFQGSGLELAWQMTEKLEIYLSGCQVGITITSVGLGVIGEPAVAAVLDPLVVAAGIAPSGGTTGHTAISVVLALAVINLLHVIIGEQAPTYLGVERTRFVAKYGAPLLYLWTKLMWPVIILADRIAKWLLGLFGVEISRSWTEEEVEGTHPSSRSELRRQMGESLSQAGLTQERQEEVLNALEIGEMPVEDVMVDRRDIVALSVTDDVETNRQQIRDHPHVRYPLVGETLDDFVGVIYTPGLFRAQVQAGRDELDIAEVAAPPLTMPATMAVSEAIDTFQAENQELALVQRDGEAVGLVTPTDCFEAITGELEDPLDKQFD